MSLGHDLPQSEDSPAYSPLHVTPTLTPHTKQTQKQVKKRKVRRPRFPDREWPHKETILSSISENMVTYLSWPLLLLTTVFIEGDPADAATEIQNDGS